MVNNHSNNDIYFPSGFFIPKAVGDAYSAKSNLFKPHELLRFHADEAESLANSPGSTHITLDDVVLTHDDIHTARTIFSQVYSVMDQGRFSQEVRLLSALNRTVTMLKYGNEFPQFTSRKIVLNALGVDVVAVNHAHLVQIQTVFDLCDELMYAVAYDEGRESLFCNERLPGGLSAFRTDAFFNLSKDSIVDFLRGIMTAAYLDGGLFRYDVQNELQVCLDGTQYNLGRSYLIDNSVYPNGTSETDWVSSMQAIKGRLTACFPKTHEGWLLSNGFNLYIDALKDDSSSYKRIVFGNGGMSDVAMVLLLNQESSVHEAMGAVLGDGLDWHTSAGVDCGPMLQWLGWYIQSKYEALTGTELIQHDELVRRAYLSSKKNTPAIPYDTNHAVMVVGFGGYPPLVSGILDGKLDEVQIPISYKRSEFVPVAEILSSLMHRTQKFSSTI